MGNSIERALRRGAELLGRNRAFPRTMTVAGARIPLWVSPDAQLKYMKPGTTAFDRDLVRLAERLVRPDSVVWDVGANIGTFSLAAASIARRGTTVAIEADIWLSSLIRRSARLGRNTAFDLRVVPCAVADRCGVATFDIAARGRASSALRGPTMGRSQMGGTRESVDVPCLTLDVIAETMPAPELIKIDVEGAEALVLRGADELMRKVRPIIYIEVGESAAAEVALLARSRDYALLSADGMPVSECTINTFLVPAEKVTELALFERLRE